MNKNICSRCKNNDHNEIECLSKLDYNGNIIDLENQLEYTNFIPKETSFLKRILDNFVIFSNTIKKILEPPISSNNQK
jgi:hypothetical protein